MNRVLGLAGLVAGTLPAMLLFIGQAAMNVRTAFLVYSIHAAWAILVSVQLVRRRI